MSELIVDKSKIDVKVDNNGVITFASTSGKICLIHLHPFDTGSLIKFLVNEDYNWGARNDTKRTYKKNDSI